MPGASQVPDAVTGDFTDCRTISDSPSATAPESWQRSATILAKYEISIDALLQKPDFPHSALPFVMTLEPCDSAVLHRALKEIERLKFHVDKPLCLPQFRGLARAEPRTACWHNTFAKSKRIRRVLRAAVFCCRPERSRKQTLFV